MSLKIYIRDDIFHFHFALWSPVNRLASATRTFHFAGSTLFLSRTLNQSVADNKLNSFITATHTLYYYFSFRSFKTFGFRQRQKQQSKTKLAARQHVCVIASIA